MMDSPQPRPRAIFFGTPEFAVPCLSALLQVAEVPLVVTQPDRRSGRGMRLQPPPVKQLAERHGLRVFQPARVRSGELLERLLDVKADVHVVVAYGRILPRAVLDAARLGSVNIHASLLPKYRGAAPIQWAILRGEHETGVCLMQMDEGMDTGPVLACRATAIGPEETAGELASRLAEMGAALLVEALPRYLRGELTPRPQVEADASHAPPLQKVDGQVVWDKPARAVIDHVRGMTPWPGAFTWWGSQRIKLHRVQLLDAVGRQAAAGEVLRADAHGIDVACGQGVVSIELLQPAGKRSLRAGEFLAGHDLTPGMRFGEEHT